MKFENLFIDTIEYALPEERLSSEKIEQLLSPLYQKLNLPEGRLELMTGIRERRLWPEGTNPSQAAALAAEKALKKSSIPREAIDVLIFCGVCRDRLEPATAAYVHNILKLKENVQILDLSNACLGFLNAFCLTGSLIEGEQAQNALIVTGENGNSLISNTIKTLLETEQTRQSIKPYFANLTIGSGAAAAIITSSKKDSELKLQIKSSSTLTDTSQNFLCEGSNSTDGLEMQTDSESLLKLGISVAKRNWLQFKETTHWDESTPDMIITHQVGKQHQRALYEELNLNLSKDYSSYKQLGNVGSASLPITLAMALENASIPKSSKIALLGIGSGLSSIMMAIES